MPQTPTAPRRRSVIGSAVAAAATAAGGGVHAPPAAAAPLTPTAAGGTEDRNAKESGVSYADKRFLIDGKPALVLAGEIHYFRLKRDEWQSRLDRAKEAGLNTIATYIPWMWHETGDGSLDVTGRTRPERDLGAFLDLCIENGFHVIARPGPFTMAELKGEGVPRRVRRDHPEIVPTGWDGKEATTKTVDYLAPAFLKEVRRWYDAVMPVIARRKHRRGEHGVIACQLDNEIGMLAWVSNSPDLTDHLLKDFNGWLDRTYGDELGDRYPFAGAPPEERDAAIRSPKNRDYAPALMHDLGAFMRGRFARYVQALREAAEVNGLTGIPFLINIHGTGGGRGDRFPIGISQLMETYSGKPGILSGADFYLGSLTVRNAVDLYLINAFMDAVHDADQPLTVQEFDAGHADYGDNLDNMSDMESGDLKTRMCLAQGVKMVNYYVFAGGRNPKLDKPAGDGNDRIGITGERHGFSAPVDPEGRRNLSYEPLKETVHTVNGSAAALARMRPEYDGVTLGFVPDLYLTEYHPPQSDRVAAMLTDLEGTRGFGPRGALTRGMLFGGFRYRAVNVQTAKLDPKEVPVLALGCAEHLGADLQRKLVDYLEAGGRLLLSGRVPVADMADEPCTVLGDALGLKPEKVMTDADRFFLSVTSHGWAAPRAEIRVGRAQICAAARGETVLREVSTGKGCGFDVEVGKGRAVVLTADYRTDLGFWLTALKTLGASPGLTHSETDPGVFLLTTADGEGDRMLHAFNVSSGYDQSFTVEENGKPLFGGERVRLPGRSAAMLPLGLRAGGLRIAYATAEVGEVRDGAVTFHAPGGAAADAVVAVDGRATCDGAKSTYEAGRTVFRVRGRADFTVRAAR